MRPRWLEGTQESGDIYIYKYSLLRGGGVLYNIYIINILDTVVSWDH